MIKLIYSVLVAELAAELDFLDTNRIWPAQEREWRWDNKTDQAYEVVKLGMIIDNEVELWIKLRHNNIELRTGYEYRK
jgi:hypothetical protein